MNKKSNIIIGLSGLAVVVLLVVGMMVFSSTGKSKTESSALKTQGGQAATQVSKVVESQSVNSATDDSGELISKTTGQFVASKQGKKYFPVDCGSVKTIKEENKVYFGSEEEAKLAGYERTLTCK